MTSPSSPSALRSPGEEADEQPLVAPTRSNGHLFTPKTLAPPQSPTGFWTRKEFTDLSKGQERRLTSLCAPQLSRTDTAILSVGRGKWKLRALHPDSWNRAAFDCVVISILLYDFLMIPYQIAWHLPFEGWLAAVSWMTLSVWAIDLLLGFVTGYHQKDKVVMNFPSIVKHYLSTYFLPNLVVLAADLTANVLEVTYPGNMAYNNYIKLSRLIKLNRVMRLWKMLQTGKVAQLADRLVTQMRMWGLVEEFLFVTRVGKLVFCIIWVNHVGCCIWHEVGKSASAKWYSQNSAVHDAGPVFSYMLSYYWSASSMIAGESLMEPTNTSEVVTMSFFVVIGFIFSSVLISSLLTTVMEYQDAGKERSVKVNTLRQFLYQHNVIPEISVPIQKQVNERISIQKRLAEKDVVALSLLSPLMRSELWNAIYGPSIADNAFIRTCNILQETFIKDICFSAMNHVAYAPGEHVFEPGTEAIGTYFVYWGSLDYLPTSDDRSLNRKRTRGLSMMQMTMSLSKNHVTRKGSHDSEQTVDTTPSHADSVTALKGSGFLEHSGPESVRQGSWVCSMALWVHWLHRGWLEAATPCELLTVKAEPFVKLLKNKPDLHTISQDYAVAVMGALEREAVSELSDIHSQVDHYSLLPAMRLETRIEFSMAASLVLEHHQWAGRLFEQDGFQELGQEIEKGECDLVVGVDNVVHRLVTITALHLERADGHILTQLGKYTRGQTITSCSVPGTKQQPKEHPKDAVERLLKAKLRPYADAVSVMYRELVDEQERVSHKYGVSSRYMRTLFAAVLEDVDFPNTTVMIPFDGGISSLSRLSSRSSRSSREVRLTQPYEAFAFVHELESSSETKFIYAWMSPEDHALITGPDAGDLAQTWVNRLLVDVLTQDFVPNEQDGSFTAI